MAANFYKDFTYGGLGTACSHSVPEAGIYAVAGTLTCPGIAQGSSANSAVVCTVNKNGSPVYASSAGAKGFHTDVNCAALDVITIVLSSALAIDNAPNAIKSTLTISLGE